jgi:hypothetical protein
MLEVAISLLGALVGAGLVLLGWHLWSMGQELLSRRAGSPDSLEDSAPVAKRAGNESEVAPAEPEPLEPALVAEPALLAEPEVADLVTEPEPEPEKPEVLGRDKRRFARLSLDESLVVAPFAGRETLAEICDVSFGGVQFRVVGLELQADDMMHITFNLSGESLTAIARVLRTQQLDDITCEVAAEFVRLDPSAARRFEEALDGDG